MIRVLVADDSAFMSMVLCDMFKKQPAFELVDTARNGKDAIEKVKKYNPDLLTMDINMPVMDGLQALKIIMKECPLPVVMCSSMTKEGADATIQALALGAVDFINKTGGSVSAIDTIETEILTKCRAAASIKIKSRPGMSAASGAKTFGETPRPVMSRRIDIPVRKPVFTPRQAQPVAQEQPIKRAAPVMGVRTGSSDGRNKIVVLGTSTGGPKALQVVVAGLPKDLPCGVLIVQHMPPGFTKSLAERLNEICQISVKEAENHDIIEAGHVYIAPGNYHMTVVPCQQGREIVLNQDPPLGTLRPAADVLFKSAVRFGSDVVSVILTGMGQDGAVGMKEIKQAGGYIIAEHESTCVVYGMPKAVVDQGIADEVLPLTEIASAIVRAVKH